MPKRDVAKRQTTTKDELIGYVQDFWRNRLTEECNTFIDHVFKVIPIVREMDGRASGNIPKKLFNESSRGRSMRYFNNKLQTPECQQVLERLV
ncbi:hypothetical protein CI610_03135 [invertebrate metagenome]|uniref:Uncharacterized protein n=1 Tax=invertebrate metagenome TaxID=1711999 RepID=A0A2H9T417_9ZZZZ